jgi:hypothetical protein
MSSRSADARCRQPLRATYTRGNAIQEATVSGTELDRQQAHQHFAVNCFDGTRD